MKFFEILPFSQEFEQNIIPQSIVENSIQETKENIINNADEKLKNDENVGNKLQNKNSIFTNEIEIYFRIYSRKYRKNFIEEYVRYIKNPKDFTDVYSINLISDWFNRNILFINGDNRMPYKYASNYDPN